MTTTLTTMKADGITPDQTVTPLAVTGLDWTQELHRTASTPRGTSAVQLQLGTPQTPGAVLTILCASYAQTTQLAAMYASKLVMVLSDPDLGVSWRHYAVGATRWTPQTRQGRLPWWQLTVTAEGAS
jgi:hypothetical protein